MRLEAAAKHLSRSLIAAAEPSRAWTTAVDQALRHLTTTTSLTPSLVAAAIDPHLLHHHSLAAGLFHWASQQTSFSHSPQSYHSFFKSLSLSRQPHSILSLLNLAKSRRVPLSPASHHLALSSLLLSNNTSEASDLFQQSTVEFPPGIYNSLLAAASSDGTPDFARMVFDRMLDRGVAFNDVGFGVFIGRLSRTAGLDEILSLVEEIQCRVPRINGSVVAVLIVDGLCKVGRIEDAWRSLEELRMRGWKPDFIAYRIVSEAFRLASRVDDSLRILKQKRKLGVAPRAKDYGEFTTSLISEGRVQETRELGEAIVNGDFPIEDDTLSSLIGSVSAVDPDSAVFFCKYMIGKERFPSITTLSNLSRNLCKKGKSNEMWDIFRVLMDTDYFTEVEQYNVMVSFLCQSGRLREAHEVFKEMKKNDFSPDISSYNTLMEACCRGDLLRPAKKLWDEMFTTGCSPNLQTYNILITKLSEEGEAEEAQQLFHHMLDKGVVPDNATYTSLVKVMCQEKRVESALEIFRRSMEQDSVIASSTLSTLILSLCKEGNFLAATGILYGVPSNIENSDSHVILLKSLIDAGEIEMAIKHLERVRENTPFKLPTLLTKFIASLSTVPNLEPILQFLQELHVRHYITEDGPWMDLLESRYGDS